MLLQRCVGGGCCCDAEKEDAEVVARKPLTAARGARLQRWIAAPPGRPMLMRVDAKQCCPDWKDCLRSDHGRAAGVATAWKLTIAVDRESTKNLFARVAAGNVGHTWIKFSDDTGTVWSYGMWPQTGFDPMHPFTPVKGCIHHPDVKHEPPSAKDYKETSYNLTEEQFDKAITYAQDQCKLVPDYNLASFNCTTFAIEAAQAAGMTPPPSSTLGVHNPNALYEGIEAEDAKGRKRAVANAVPNP